MNLPQVNGDRLLRALQRAGWVIERSTGSHHILQHPDRPGKRTNVSVHRRAVKRGTLLAILKDADMTVDELKELL